MEAYNNIAGARNSTNQSRTTKFSAHLRTSSSDRQVVQHSQNDWPGNHNDFSSLQKQNDMLQQECHALMNKSRYYMQQCDELNEQLENERQTSMSLSNKIQALERDLDMATKTLFSTRQLQESESRMQCQVELLQTENKKVKAHENELQVEIEQLKRERNVKMMDYQRYAKKLHQICNAKLQKKERICSEYEAKLRKCLMSMDAEQRFSSSLLSSPKSNNDDTPKNFFTPRFQCHLHEIPRLDLSSCSLELPSPHYGHYGDSVCNYAELDEDIQDLHQEFMDSLLPATEVSQNEDGTNMTSEENVNNEPKIKHNSRTGIDKQDSSSNHQLACPKKNVIRGLVKPMQCYLRASTENNQNGDSCYKVPNQAHKLMTKDSEELEMSTARFTECEMHNVQPGSVSNVAEPEKPINIEVSSPPSGSSSAEIVSILRDNCTPKEKVSPKGIHVKTKFSNVEQPKQKPTQPCLLKNSASSQSLRNAAEPPSPAKRTQSDASITPTLAHPDFQKNRNYETLWRKYSLTEKEMSAGHVEKTVDALAIK